VEVARVLGEIADPQDKCFFQAAERSNAYAALQSDPKLAAANGADGVEPLMIAAKEHLESLLPHERDPAVAFAVGQHFRQAAEQEARENGKPVPTLDDRLSEAKEIVTENMSNSIAGANARVAGLGFALQRGQAGRLTLTGRTAAGPLPIQPPPAAPVEPPKSFVEKIEDLVAAERKTAPVAEKTAPVATPEKPAAASTATVQKPADAPAATATPEKPAASVAPRPVVRSSFYSRMAVTTVPDPAKAKDQSQGHSQGQ
jgi:hypothetical protein